MTVSKVLALDAMGGDRAPGIVVAGANMAIKRFPDARFRLVGKPDRIGKILRRFPKLANVSEVVPADVVIESDMKPSLALRRGAGSSMKLAIDDVRSGRAAGVVSAGNTGAMMAMAKLALRTLPGIRRPAIASTYPTLRGQSVMLDLGANIDCDADNLVQFAIMGAAFARSVQGLPRALRGSAQRGQRGGQGARGDPPGGRDPEELQTCPSDFHGFIEGNDITEGTVDVVVADGFSGQHRPQDLRGNGEPLHGLPARDIPPFRLFQAGLPAGETGASRVARTGSTPAATTAACFSDSTAWRSRATAAPMPGASPTPSALPST